MQEDVSGSSATNRFQASEAGVDERCNGSQFACDSGQCVYVLLKCDGTRDCDDASDETTPMCTAPSTAMRVGDRRTAYVDFTSDAHEGLELLMCDTAGACSRLTLWGLLAKPKNATAKPEESGKGKRKGAAKPQDSPKVTSALKPGENSKVKGSPKDAAGPKASVTDAPRPEAPTPELQANGSAQSADVQCRLAYTASSGCRPRGEYCVKRHHKAS
ncbi:hypothetical protein ONE63_010367 [Megalurothrips usitatus]|uniref:Uncharacterized protein n=1 Tax=Megalurothrips usitatus TaxID=439358 RepID=A0AAV7XPJ8_9NEOP|nr:hypothetical protein ONE63_010367 [Megalurothrips usitatus]